MLRVREREDHGCHSDLNANNLVDSDVTKMEKMEKTPDPATVSPINSILL